MSDDKAYQREPIGPCDHCGEWPTHDRDWPAFWRSLPPREMLEAAKAMPKAAGPWEDRGGQFVRRDVRRRGDWVAFTLSDGISGDVHVPTLRETFPDRASADAALRAAEWVLCDEETKP